MPRIRATPTTRIGGWLFLLSLSVYLATAAGYVQTEDVSQALRVAAALVHHHDVHITGSPVLPYGGLVIGDDGRTYAAHGLGLSLLLVPAVWSEGLVGTAGVPHVASALAPLLGAASVSAVYALALRLGAGVRASVGAALLFAFCSIAWPYAHFSFDATATGLFLLLGVLGLLTPHERGRAWLAWAGAGAAVGFATVIRADAALLLPGVLLLAAGRARATGDVVRKLSAWSLPLLTMLALAGWANAARFGSVLDVGHADDPFLRTTTPLLEGLYGLLVSPGKGLFVYSPTLVLGVAGLVLLFRRQPLPAVSLGLITITAALTHAPLAGWAGDEAWGPRFLVPVAGLLAAPAGLVLERWRSLPAWLLTGALAAAGAAVQVVGVAVAYLPVMRLPGQPASDYLTGRGWPIGRHLSALLRSLKGGEPYPDRSHGGIVTPPVPRLDVWWAREAAEGRHLVATVVALLVLLVVAVVAAVLLVRALRRAHGPVEPRPGPEDRTDPRRDQEALPLAARPRDVAAG